MTTRGFGREEMKHVASLIMKVVSNIGNPDIHRRVREEVSQLCARFPVNELMSEIV
jgi:glycine/serine hydroxymethyltransferase